MRAREVLSLLVASHSVTCCQSSDWLSVENLARASHGGGGSGGVVGTGGGRCKLCEWAPSDEFLAIFCKEHRKSVSCENSVLFLALPVCPGDGQEWGRCSLTTLLLSCDRSLLPQAHFRPAA